MGTMTVTVKDDVEKRFRKAASRAMGTGKGSLGKAVTAALDSWVEKEDPLSFLEKGLPLGGLKEKDRARWHERHPD
ncbi:MAG: hypothetical protein HY520_00270 [Candidatus Aenigmarchaeota archaeon]|nr:hypothetical protein [Candidatus Aenigmarchaeota archaeon]